MEVKHVLYVLDKEKRPCYRGAASIRLRALPEASSVQPSKMRPALVVVRENSRLLRSNFIPLTLGKVRAYKVEKNLFPVFVQDCC